MSLAVSSNLILLTLTDTLKSSRELAQSQYRTDRDIAIDVEKMDDEALQDIVN